MLIFVSQQVIPVRCSQWFPNAAAEQGWDALPCLAPAVSGKASQELLWILKLDEGTSVVEFAGLKHRNRQAGGSYAGGKQKKGGEDSSAAVEACGGMPRGGLRCRLLLRCAGARSLGNWPFSRGMGSRCGLLCCTHAGEQIVLLLAEKRYGTVVRTSTAVLVFARAAAELRASARRRQSSC